MKMKTAIKILILLFTITSLSAQNNFYRLLVGTYTNTGKSEGIYSYDIDMQHGIFTRKSVAKELNNPSFLTLTPDKKFIYAISESNTGSKAGAFGFDVETGLFTFLNTSETHGSGPCYVSVTKQHVIAANYEGGSISVFGRNANGSLSDVLQVIQHSGSSIDPKRQTKPYVHQVLFTPDEKYLVVNDLGTDKVTVYQYDKNQVSNNILIPYDSITVKKGSGPRQSTFDKSGKYIYLLQEIDGTVTVMNMNNGRLQVIQETSVVVKAGIETGAADIHLSPDGKFLYATNRGTANDITCFSVAKDGKLTFKQQVSTGGVGPRNFSITPDGNYIFVGNQKTDNIVIFNRDCKTGLLTNSGKQIELGAPVCLLFY